MDEESSPEGSRPSSRAQSDATEVQAFHQGPRTVASDIEHIKTLISRSATAPSGAESSISAQVFRSRSGSIGSNNGPISQQRLFHELDLLKKRIKNEQHHVRRPSQIDPETESESEDAVDEREEELENIRERLVHERRQSEDLLSAAESRIDSLMGEKENISKLLRSNRIELAKLEKFKVDLDAALAESTQKIEELEENNRAASEEVQRLLVQHKSREDESRRLYEDLQVRHDQFEKEAEDSRAKVRELEKATGDHETIKAQVESLVKERDEHKANLELQRKQMRNELEEAQSEHMQQLERSTSDLEGLSTRLTIEQQENESLRDQLKSKQDDQQERADSADARIAQMEEAIAVFEQRAASAEASLKSKEEELGASVVAKEHEIADIQRELSELHKKLYEQSIELEGKNAELSKATENAEMYEATASLRTDLAKAKQARDAANRGWADDIARMKAEHGELLEELQQGWSAKADEATRAHNAELSSAQEILQNKTTELRASSERRLADVNEEHASELVRLKEELQLETIAQLTAVKKSHWNEISRVHTQAESELATALAHADEDLDERLRNQSKSHRKELDKLHESLNIELTQLHVQLEEASQLRQTQMEEVETQHQNALANVSEKLEAAEQALAALQSRLDAELTGRAEAERSLAGLRKQRFEEDKTYAETKEALQLRIDGLEAERDVLTRRPSATPISSTSESREPGLESSISRESSEDVSTLKEKLALAEQQREEAQALIEQKQAEMARQNEFLVNELETLMAQRNIEAAMAQRDFTRRPPIPLIDASVQTEPVAGYDGGLTTLSFTEPKADIATSQALKRREQEFQPPIGGFVAPDAKRKSFEDYLKAAQAELSDLGLDLSANEELFSEKVQEHLAELQSAKDDLSTEYQHKFGTLLAEKARMERAVSAKSAADFTRARNRLLTRYGIDDGDPARQVAMLSSLPQRKQNTVRSLEEALVSDYSRRVTKRKSQIAVKHAEKFHLLTQDFNRRMGALVNGKEIAEVDSPASANGVERNSAEVDFADLESERTGVEKRGNRSSSIPALNEDERTQLENALRAAADTTPKSRLPQRISISKPRTPASIPRAVPYRGGWNSGEATSQSETASPSNRSPPVSATVERRPSRLQRKTSKNVKSQTQLPADSESSDALTHSVVAAFRRLSIEPNDSEGDIQQGRPLETKPQRPKPRRMRHSSRAIFEFQQTSES